MIHFRDDAARLKAEWPHLDARLRVMLYALDGWLREHGGPEVTITCLLRTQAENAAIYGHAQVSPHTDYRAADVRITGWPDGLAEQARKWLCQTFPRVDRPVCILEGTAPGSTGPHLHLQVPAPLHSAVAAFSVG